MWLNSSMEQPRHSKQNKDRWDMDRIRFHMDHPPSPQRDIKSVGEILKDVVSGFEQPVQDSVLILRESWSKLVGAQIAQHSEPGFIKENALHIFVDHPGWMPELERHKRGLLMKLQSSYRTMRIRQIRFILKHK
jgi:hypothetical protein